jgi:16S rRNA (cytidine1402-2'-O)-methyltransferase
MAGPYGGDEGNRSGDDTGPDPGPDTGPDTVDDTGPDTGPDTVDDTGPDPGPNTGFDDLAHGEHHEHDHPMVGGTIKPGSLVLVATPIGNLADLSPRALSVLRYVDAIACEDTRHTRKLLSAHSINGKRLLAVHEHNEADAAEGLIKLLGSGAIVALVTDAGTPGISDPGERVVAIVATAGFSVICIPGPVAFIAALVVSGLPTARFVFDGFLPRSGPERAEAINEISISTRTTVLYESPNRIVKTLLDLLQACGGDRPVSVSRELTKRFEETWRGALGAAVTHFQAVEPRGEFVIVVGPPSGGGRGEASDEDINIALRNALATGLRTSEAVDAVVATTGAQKKRVYALALILVKSKA